MVGRLQKFMPAEVRNLIGMLSRQLGDRDIRWLTPAFAHTNSYLMRNSDIPGLWCPLRPLAGWWRRYSPNITTQRLTLTASTV